MVTLAAARSALAGIQGAKEMLKALQAEASTRLAAAQSHQDPALSMDGLQQRRHQLRQDVMAELLARLSALAHRTDSDAQTVESALVALRPSPAQDPAALMRVQMKWSQVLMRLDAGEAIEAVLAAASLEEVFAVREFGPSWQRSRFPRVSRTVLGERDSYDPRPLLRAVDERFAELDADFAAAVAVKLDADLAMAWFTPIAEHMQRILTGNPSSAASAALEAHYAAQAVEHPRTVQQTLPAPAPNQPGHWREAGVPYIEV